MLQKGTVSGEITLTWDVSCLASDTDYEIYEGVLGGDFTGHTSLYCSTGGQTTSTFVPPVGDTYYLVVPRNGGSEGSYGTDSDGFERSQGASACTVQLIGACR